MANNDTDGLNLDDPDRLPWLETADGYEYDDGSSPMRVAGMVLGGLALLAAIVGAIYWAQRNRSAGTDGNGQVIAAKEGNYKVRPDDAEGKKFEGEGDSAFAASEGKKSATTIGAASPDAKASASSATASETIGAKAGAYVQLGAFGDTAEAAKTWDELAKRFGFLSGANHRIAEGTADSGRKVFRLQVASTDAAAAQQLCAKIKAAGENCLIVK
jgi:hypothetical protein